MGIDINCHPSLPKLFDFSIDASFALGLKMGANASITCGEGTIGLDADAGIGLAGGGTVTSGLEVLGHRISLPVLHTAQEASAKTAASAHASLDNIRGGVNVGSMIGKKSQNISYGKSLSASDMKTALGLATSEEEYIIISQSKSQYTNFGDAQTPSMELSKRESEIRYMRVSDSKIFTEEEFQALANGVILNV